MSLTATTAPTATPTPLEFEHSGGGLISVVMRDVVDKLPAAPDPTSPVKNATALVRTVRLSGVYWADVVLKLPPYTRLVLDGTLQATPALNAANGAGTDGRSGFGQLGTGLVYASGDMVGVEGGHFDCSGWNSSQTDPSNGTSTLAGILFNGVLGGWIRGSTITNCGCGSKGGSRPGYVSGNICPCNGPCADIPRTSTVASLPNTRTSSRRRGETGLGQLDPERRQRALLQSWRLG